MKLNVPQGLLLGAFVIASLAGLSQERRPGAPPTQTPAGAGNPQGRPANGAPQASKGPKPYKEVITEKAETRQGLLIVHKLDDKYFLEVPFRLFGKDMLVVNRISKGAAEVRSGFFGYAGDIIGETVIKMERGPEDKIFVNEVSFRERSQDSTGGMYQSVKNSNILPIIQSFDIKAYGKDSTSAVIDVTSWIGADNDVLFFGSSLKRALSLGAVQPDKSYIIDVTTYPNNVNIKTVKTYSRAQAPTSPTAGRGGGGQSTTPATFELNNSIILLPSKPMKPRIWDERVGYFATRYVDFDANPQGVKNVTLALRWKLEPKPEDVGKYLRGELVEPQKPIVYYIDPATPKKWVPYLIQGVNDWQVAFEKAGFKNAIYARMAPTPQEDSTWSLEDARYSAIVYKPSDIPNASGPNVNDPRTGEILESHINWYHNVMKLVHDWYMVQTAAVDPNARKMTFDDELMGQLIRFVSSHEVGHTLGLRHNFGSSSTVPVENLRNKAWVEANGHTPSIMDYARFNYVAQPEDGITQKGLFPRIGDYDIWAIEWGYKWIPESSTAQQDIATLNNLTIERLKNPRLWWGDGETNRNDPRSQSEDLGNNAMTASTYGIKNLQRIVPNLVTWTKEPNEGYDGLQEIYNQVSSQFGRYIGHVSRYVGGIERTPKTVEQPGPVYTYTSKARQKEAMKWMQDNVFKTPTWLIDQKIMANTSTTPQSVIAGLQNRALNALINGSTAEKLQQFEAEKGSEAYTLNEMMTDLRKGIFSELAARKPVDIYRRQLQKSFTEKVTDLLAPKPASQTISFGGASIQLGSSSTTTSDLISIAKAQLKTLRAEMKAATPLIADSNTKMHLTDLMERIDQALNPK